MAELMTLVVVEPTIGCRQYADSLDELGYTISKTTVQKILGDHGLGRRRDRIARAAATASLAGPVTAAHTIAFIDHVRRTMRRLGVPVQNV